MPHSPTPALFAALLLAPLTAQPQRPPSRTEVKKLVAHYLELDPKVGTDRIEQLSIVERLDALKPLKAREVSSWRKKLARAFARGRRLEPSAGEHWWQEKPERRGRYLIGGKLSSPRGLVIAMHGGGAGSGDARGAFSAFDGAAKRLGWLAIYPEVLQKTERGWTDSGTEEWIIDLIAAARRTFRVPGNRIYLCGHSMGGYGSWTLGAHHADLVAGVAPSAGAPTPILDPETDRPIDVVEGVIPSLRNVRLAVYQSDDDPRVPPGANRVAIAKLEAAQKRWGGFDHEYWEVSGRAHELPPGGAIALLEKIADARRDARPSRVVWQPVLMWKRQFYWLRWEWPIPKAIVVADCDRAKNTITITGDKTKGLEVLLDDELVDLDKEVVVTRNGTEVWRGVPERRLSTLLLTSQHGDPDLMFPARVVVEPR